MLLPALTGRTGGGKTVWKMFIGISKIGRNRIRVGEEAGWQFELSEGFHWVTDGQILGLLSTGSLYSMLSARVGRGQAESAQTGGLTGRSWGSVFSCKIINMSNLGNSVWGR